MKNNTQIRSLLPFSHAGQWVFNDKTNGLYHEEFVGGMTEIIYELLEEAGIDVGRAEEFGFRLTFSANEWPDSSHCFKWLREEYGGDVYSVELANGLIMEGWLCPALKLYFDEAPKEIHVQCRA